ncbi:MAG TPA: cytochrome c biogenesis protein ResB, partial [Streptosporangiaceae bacterium]|nr:cytochrome c biogenesis protein ResB [Streptosporangiaceae bacterium]
MTGLRTPPDTGPATPPGDDFAEPEAAAQAIARKPGVRLGVAGWLRWGWRQLTSMRTALVLLFLLAAGSIPGSLLP